MLQRGVCHPGPVLEAAAARSRFGLGKHRSSRRLQRRLVSIGRYSARFLDALKAKWDEGWLGYEEISLPMLCVQPAC